jgi:hypothetical protein
MCIRAPTFPPEHHFLIFKTIRLKENQEILLNNCKSKNYKRRDLWNQMVVDINQVGLK